MGEPPSRPPARNNNNLISRSSRRRCGFQGTLGGTLLLWYPERFHAWSTNTGCKDGVFKETSHKLGLLWSGAQLGTCSPISPCTIVEMSGVRTANSTHRTVPYKQVTLHQVDFTSWPLYILPLFHHMLLLVWIGVVGCRPISIVC